MDCPRTAFLLAALAACSGGTRAALPPSAPRPNLVLFLADDLGWQDTSVPFHVEPTPFNRLYRTPAMERLAKTGVKFTQAYACTVCSPSRISLMTGLNAARHRVTNWTLRKDTATDAPHPFLTMPDWNVNGLSPVPGIPRTVHAKPLPALLREAGYRTIHIGKAHFGAVGTPGEDPRALGFDVNVAGHAAGGPGSYLGTQNFSGAWRRADRIWDVPGLEKYHGQDIFLTEALTLEAIREVERAIDDGVPFFLYLAHYAVHVPFAEDRRFIGRYREMGLHPKEAMYAALVEGLDKSLGDILDLLDRRGLAGRTAVFFMSDNGGLSAHERGGEPHTHNRPLCSGKGSAREGGIRVPMIARWPGATPAGVSCAAPVLIEDFFPTILEIAGVEGGTAKTGPIDGRSFTTFLRDPGAPAGDRPLFWHFPNHWGPKGPGIGPSSTVRQGDWKLIYYHADRSMELFNLREDLGETRNLAEERPEVRDRLARLLRDHLAAVKAQMPRDRKSGEPVPLP